ncbi:MAG: hypothetical protein PWQ28_101 [Candidatus Woesearchaeota archaeon]|nr:hypothetical protein [Candidatus Woesearchaeota archaeon]
MLFSELIAESLDSLIFPFLYILVLIIVILFVVLFLKTNIKKDLINIFQKRDLFVFLLVTLAFLFLRKSMVQPQFVMYTDEGYYVKQGRMIYENGFFEIERLTRSLGWSFLIALSLKISYTMNSILILNQVLFIIGGFILFILAKKISKSTWIALISVLFFVFYAGGFFWSTTADNFIAAGVFLLVSILFFFNYIKTDKKIYFYLATAFLGFSSVIRRELFIVFLPLIAVPFFFQNGRRNVEKRKNKMLFLWTLFIFILLFPALLHEFQYYNTGDFLSRESHGKFEGSSFSLKNLIYNTKTFLPVFLKQDYFPISLTIFFICSLPLLIKERSRKSRDYAFFFFCFLTFLSLIFISFFSWFQTLGGSLLLWPKTKFFWLISIPMILFSIIFLKWINELKIKKSFVKNAIKISLLFIVLFSLRSPMLTIKSDFSVSRNVLQFRLTDLVNEYLKENNLTDAVIFTPFSELVPLTPQAETITNLSSINDERFGLFLFDFSCNYNQKLCEEMRIKSGEKVKDFNLKEVTFSLYNTQ